MAFEIGYILIWIIYNFNCILKTKRLFYHPIVKYLPTTLKHYLPLSVLLLFVNSQMFHLWGSTVLNSIWKMFAPTRLTFPVNCSVETQLACPMTKTAFFRLSTHFISTFITEFISMFLFGYQDRIFLCLSMV